MHSLFYSKPIIIPTTTFNLYLLYKFQATVLWGFNPIDTIIFLHMCHIDHYLLPYISTIFKKISEPLREWLYHVKCYEFLDQKFVALFKFAICTIWSYLYSILALGIWKFLNTLLNLWSNIFCIKGSIIQGFSVILLILKQVFKFLFHGANLALFWYSKG